MSKIVEIKKQTNTGRTHFKKGSVPWNAGKMKMVTFNCATCSITVTRQYKKDRSNRFCSVACSNKALHTPEIMEKSRLGRTGVRRTLEQRRKYSGERSWNWRGGITKANLAIRNSFAYKLWRKAIFERDDYTCQECGNHSGNGKAVVLHADHIKPFAYFPELRFEMENGRTLCKDCHKKTDSFAGRVVANYKTV